MANSPFFIPVRDSAVYVAVLGYFVLQPATSHLEESGVIFLGVVGFISLFNVYDIALSGEAEGLIWSVLAVMPVGVLPLL